MTDVQGRTAFITGGGNGIGLGIAQAFARAGVKLALADIDAVALETARARLQGLTTVEPVVLDVRDRKAYARTADRVERALGPVSILVNNAGVACGWPAGKMTYEVWDWVIGINLHGVINGIQTFLPRMLERGGGGHIVNTASGAGLAATASGVLYTTSKYAVVGMSETLDRELAPQGIHVTVLCPGPVATDIVARSAQAQPAVDLNMTEEVKRRTADAIARVTEALAHGVSPDAAGEMVLRAVRDNSIYVHTDRTMIGMIEARCRALLDAMPAA
jgi:NAD(P)-dependent dehydrogenase (short-subunit alcohol dehydrogenase family)